MMPRCPRHGEPLDDELRACWKCVEAERDRRFEGTTQAASSWWKAPLPRCDCVVPYPRGGWCVNCARKLRAVAPDAKIGAAAA